jgi:pyruvate,water dikinase
LADLAAIVKINHDESKHLVAIHNDNTFFAVAYYATLSKKMRRLLGDETGAFTSRLVTGLATLESAKPVFEIYRLFELVAISPELTKIFQMTEVNDILNRLQESQHQEVKDFLTQMTQFLLKYGYRAVSEAELMHPSWEEDPSFVFSMIQNYLNASKAGKVENPQVIETRQRLERQSAVREMHARLGFFNRRIFDYLLKETCTFIPGRENNKAVVMMGSNEVKRAMNEIGRRLVKSGQIEDKKDLYFLTIDEILALCRGEGVDVNGLIPNRKAEYYRNQTVRLPETFRGHPRPLPPEEEASNEAAQGTQVLKGLPISPGRVTGPARVILDPMQESRIAPGEILVAPVTDASWTPLFLLAKGLVVDIGGLLSHGSVVAREYGIPGVLNVINGTKRIKNGQIITVDGNRGEVYLHPQSGQ